MISDTLKTLCHPFESGDLPTPGRSGRALFLGAVPGFRLPDGFGAELTAVQGFRTDFLALEHQGVTVLPRVEGEGYDLALALCGRHRGRNEAWLSEALARTRAGGVIVVAGGRKEGADSLRKRVSGLLPLDGHLSKYHGVVFWLTRPHDDVLAASQPVPGENASQPVEGRFETASGMFSHDRVDSASRLLAECLPAANKGRVADFGAGWGFLAAEVLARDGGLTALDLYEADFESLEAARRNLSGSSVPLGFFWQDLSAEPVPRQYDLVVMNPPFHQGRAAEPAIGQGMIRAASNALKPGGRLMMVANSGLPYEKTLEAHFRRQEELRREAGFKVIAATR